MTLPSLLMSFRHLIIFLTKLWALVSMLFKKQVRNVSFKFLKLKATVYTKNIISFTSPKVMQHKSVTYIMCPLSPASDYRLSKRSKFFSIKTKHAFRNFISILIPKSNGAKENPGARPRRDSYSLASRRPGAADC